MIVPAAGHFVMQDQPHQVANLKPPLRLRREDLAMPTPTTTEQDNLQSRLPDPTQFFPEMAGIAGAMNKATLNGSIPQTTIGLVQLRAGQIVAALTTPSGKPATSTRPGKQRSASPLWRHGRTPPTAARVPLT